MKDKGSITLLTKDSADDNSNKRSILLTLRRLLMCTTATLILSTVLLTWPPFYVVMDERLRMRPGLPAYDAWKNVPDKVLLRMYVFNVTNAQEFLDGIHAKLQLEEIGPIVFLEKLTHKNVVFNENDTLTYRAKRTAVYLPEMNNIDLNATLIVPNIGVLGIASYLWDASFVTKIGYNVLFRTLRSQVLTSTTIYNHLWNNSDPMLELGQTLVPSLVPVKNVGIISIIYNNFDHLLTVYIGTKFGSKKFFLIDQFDGSEYLPNFDYTCHEKLVNATEGVTYPQFLTKNTTLLYWRKTICKAVSLTYERDAHLYGLKWYRFVLNKNNFNRTKEDCHRGDPPLPNGLIEVSNCYYDLPIAISFPHFLYADEITRTYVNGLKPAADKHGSFVHVEPLTGIPFESRARLQGNLIVRELSGFNDALERFSDTIIPIFWIEYNQVDLPFYIVALIFVVVNVMPHLHFLIILVMLTATLVLAFIFCHQAKR